MTMTRTTLKIHQTVISPLITSHDGDDLDPELEQAIDELYEYGYIYRWINEQTSEWMSAAYVTEPNASSSDSQHVAFQRLRARFPNGPWRFPGASEETERARQAAIKALEESGGKTYLDDHERLRKWKRSTHR